jgi:hypothetical protein
MGVLPHELDGTFAVLLHAADVPHPDEAGFWYLTLSPSSGYVFGMAPSDPLQNAGALTVSGRTVTFSAERGQGACDGAGSYRYTVSGATLSFTVVSELCTVRAKQTTTQAYRRCSGGPATCVQPG